MLCRRKNICVGVDVKNVGRNVDITSISTAFARDIANALNEKLIYPENREDLEKAVQEFSSRHNRGIYPEQPISGDKDIPELSILQGNNEITTESGDNVLYREKPTMGSTFKIEQVEAPPTRWVRRYDTGYVEEIPAGQGRWRVTSS